jgi:asparagine N-glycosylation enzyme membrane subunit Stt3
MSFSRIVAIICNTIGALARWVAAILCVLALFRRHWKDAAFAFAIWFIMSALNSFVRDRTRILPGMGITLHEARRRLKAKQGA